MEAIKSVASFMKFLEEIRDGALAFWAWFKASRIGWFYGYDLDPDSIRVGAKKLAFGDKDGYSVFNALATFGLAQAAALTVVARSEEYKLLVLGIYGGAVLVTLVWTVAMLRAERLIVPPPAPPASPSARAYDQPSIRHGRWVVSWTLLLSGVLIYLGYKGLLPNQTPRVEFGMKSIDSDTYDKPTDWPTPGGKQQQSMDEWIHKLDSTQEEADKEGFFLIMQKTPFPESYKPFALSLKCDPKFNLGQRTAFLVQTAQQGYRPVYRQVPFRKPGLTPGDIGDTLDIEDANRGEYLLILLFAKPPKDEGFKDHEKPSRKTLGISLRPHFSVQDNKP